MSNGFGPKYESQWNTPQPQGWKQSKGMKTIEDILGFTRGIAGNVQQNKTKRDSIQVGWLVSLTDGYSSNYSDLSIQNMKDKIKDYRQNNLNKMSADAMDRFDIQDIKLNEHHDNVKHYNNMVGSIDALPTEAYKIIEELAEHSALSDDKKKAYAKDTWGKTRAEREDDLRGTMTSFATNMRDFFGRHGERVNSQNPYLAKRYLDFQRVLVQSVDALDDGLMSKSEKNYFRTNLLQPNPEAISAKNNTLKQSREFVNKEQREFIDKNAARYNQNNSVIEGGFISTEEGSSGYTSEGEEANIVYIGHNPEQFYGKQKNDKGEPLYNASQLKEKVLESKNERNSLILEQGILWGQLNQRSESYFAKHDYNLLEELGVKKYDYSIPAPEVGEGGLGEGGLGEGGLKTDENFAKGVERPEAGQRAKIVDIKDEFDKKYGLTGTTTIIEPKKKKPKEISTKVNNFFNEYSMLDSKLKQIKKWSPHKTKDIDIIESALNENLRLLRKEGYNVGIFGNLVKFPKPRPRITGAPKPRH